MWRTELTAPQARGIMSSGDIPPEIRGISGRVAVILTQSWCPQWRAMDAYLERMQAEQSPETADLTVFYLCYDLLPFSDEFMSFKESRFANDQIPFALYYRGGQLKETSNYVSESGFLGLF
ncbi:MAG: hypothetical protein LBQ57_03485 [Spirochaetales bacterium]|jgi:hypothetical protein|nr:hypothetical protein [Spirochaetales bacterium]